MNAPVADSVPPPVGPRSSRTVGCWWTMCGGLAAYLLFIPFGWRMNGVVFVPLMLIGCLLIPIAVTILVHGLIMCLGYRKLPARHFLAGLACVAIAFMLTVQIEPQVQRWNFLRSYPAYRSVVQKVLRDHPAAAPDAKANVRAQLVAELVRESGAYGGDWRYERGGLRVRFDTPCGPSLENVVFSPTPITVDLGSKLKLVFQDDVGCWYLVVRARK